MSNEIIDRLRGQLQNCVNHLDRMKRKNPSYDKTLNPCIESANKALYETLHAEAALQPSLPQDLEEWITEHSTVAHEISGLDMMDAIDADDLRAFLAGKVLVEVAKCPNAGCNDTGCIPVQIAHDDWDPQQCEFCHTVPNSKFNLEAMLTASKEPSQ